MKFTAPTVGDLIFVDTNILLTATDESRQGHKAARRLLSDSGTRGLHLAVSGQILREYLVVATRPLDANGLGLATQEAIFNVNVFLRYVELYEESRASATRLREIGEALRLRGKRFHDANIVATMLVHGIRFLVTDNLSDFASFKDINSLALADVAATE